MHSGLIDNFKIGCSFYLMKYLNITKSGVSLSVKLTPGAKKTKIIGVYGDSIKISVAQAPVDGKANQELVEFLAQIFALKKSQIAIIRGQTSPRKVLELQGAKLDFLSKILDQHLKGD